MMNAVQTKMTAAENSHSRFEEGCVASNKLRRGSLRYDKKGKTWNRVLGGLAMGVALIARSAFSVTLPVPWYANPSVSTTTYYSDLVSRFDESSAPIATAWATVSADEALSGRTVIAKRMSHSDDFRPRLYALCSDGAIVIYTLTKDLATIMWTTVWTSADLIARVNENGGTLATGKLVTKLEVVDKDGATAFVKFGDSSSYVALAHKCPQWIYYAANATGSPYPSLACVTDGHWVFPAKWESGDALCIGTWQKSIYLNSYMAEYIDMSNMRVKKWDMNYYYNFGRLTSPSVVANSDGKCPRALLYSGSYDPPDQPGMQMIKTEELYFGGWATWIKNWSGPGSVRRFVFSFNTVKKIADNALSSGGLATWGTDSDFSDISLPAVTNIGVNAFTGFKGRGTLTLPSIVLVGKEAFSKDDNLEAIVLGAEKKTLKTLSSGAFKASSAGSLRRATLGCTAGFTLSATDVFDNQPLEVVEFTGAVPTITAATAWPDTAAHTMTFVVPKDDSAWATVIASATALTEQERKDFHAAHPSHPIPFGVIPASTFKTHYEQCIAYPGNASGVSLTIQRNENFDDSVAIESDWAAFADGTYPTGTVVRLTANPNATGTFRKWYGDVPKGEDEEASITLTLTNDVWLYSRMVHPWRIAADKTTASDGVFTVNCAVVDESKRQIRFGKGWGAYLFATANTGCGICDLGGTVYDADDNVWTVYEMAPGGHAWVGTGGVTGLLTPGTLTRDKYNAAGDLFNRSGEQSRYELVIIDEPTATWNWYSNWYMSGQNKLSKFIVRIPKMTAMSSNYGFNSAPLVGVNLSWWDLSGVSSIATGLFRVNSTDSTRISAHGTLSLPKMRVVPQNTFISMANVEAFAFGGATAAYTVTAIATNAFNGDVSLKRLRLHSDENLTVGTTPFSAGKTPGEFFFTGVAPKNSAVFDNLLSGITSADKPVMIRIVDGDRSWKRRGYIDRNVTAAERGLAGDESKRVLGVIRGESGGVSFVKALVIWPNDDVRQGMVLFIR